MRRTGSGNRWLDVSLVCLVAGAWLQLLPLPESVLTTISPETRTVIEAVRLVARDTTLTSVSVEPRSTVWAAGVLTANVLLFWSVCALFQRGDMRWSVRVIAWLGIVFATLGLAQAASGSGAVYWWWAPFGEGAEPFGTFINRNHFATWVIMATPACVGYAIAQLYVSATDDPTHHWTARLVSVFDGRALFLLFAGILMTVALLVTLSRSGLLGLTAATVFVVLVGSRQIDRRRRRWLGAYVTAAAIIVVAFADTDALVQRFNQTVATSSGRIAIWRETLPLIEDFWATGTDAGTYQTAMLVYLVYQESDRVVYFNQAHNQYLQIVAEGGLLLSIPAAVALLSFLRLARRRVMSDRTAVFWIRIGAAGGLVAVMVQNLWETGLRMPANAALAAVLAALVIHAHAISRTETSSPRWKSRCRRLALHPGSRRCFSVEYRRYAPSSHLTQAEHGAEYDGSRCGAGLSRRTARRHMGLRLGFDIDGVLADFQTALGSACRDLIGIEAGLVSARDLPTVELKRAWRRIIRTPNWWTTLSAYEPDQIARLYDLTRRNRWEVFFLTKRPPTVGDTVQVQTQWWIESQGFYLPSVATVPSSRGEIAQALRLDLVVDDQFVECVDCIGSSAAKALLMLRDTADQATHDQATSQGIGIVSTLAEALDVIEQLDTLVGSKSGALARLKNWFSFATEDNPVLPMNPRETRPLPTPRS